MPTKIRCRCAYADESVHLGPTAAESYLNIPLSSCRAKKSGADAIHPGYGFLSENEEFARAVEEAGMIFIGPRPETIALTGDKAGCPPGGARSRPAGAARQRCAGRNCHRLGISEGVTFPVLIKAVSGGGGRGIRLARSARRNGQHGRGGAPGSTGGLW
jgi:acetyl-CoA carboxylase, biotin carboxylase subunit